jgi:hypothetical protein
VRDRTSNLNTSPGLFRRLRIFALLDQTKSSATQRLTSHFAIIFHRDSFTIIVSIIIVVNNPVYFFQLTPLLSVVISAVEPCQVYSVPWSGKHSLLPCLWSEASESRHGFESGDAAAGGGRRETRQDPKLLHRCSVPYFSNTENFPTTDHILISISSTATSKFTIACSSSCFTSRPPLLSRRISKRACASR